MNPRSVFSFVDQHGCISTYRALNPLIYLVYPPHSLRKPSSCIFPSYASVSRLQCWGSWRTVCLFPNKGIRPSYHAQFLMYFVPPPESRRQRITDPKRRKKYWFQSSRNPSRNDKISTTIQSKQKIRLPLLDFRRMIQMSSK